jgi:DNA-directed RNA polymerase specialized sigma24 family protein
MPLPGSVTHWLALLRGTNPPDTQAAQAAQQLWERYFDQLVRLARSRLRGVSCRAADEEDVALSAFADLCAALQRDRYPQLADRHGLWRLLVTITARKAANLVVRQRPASAPASEEELESAVGQEPSPEFAAQAAEEYQRLLAALPAAIEARERP